MDHRLLLAHLAWAWGLDWSEPSSSNLMMALWWVIHSTSLSESIHLLLPYCSLLLTGWHFLVNVIVNTSSSIACHKVVCNGITTSWTPISRWEKWTSPSFGADSFVLSIEKSVILCIVCTCGGRSHSCDMSWIGCVAILSLNRFYCRVI